MTNWVRSPWWEPFPLLRQLVSERELHDDLYAQMPLSEQMSAATRQVRQILEAKDEILSSICSENAEQLYEELVHISKITQNLLQIFEEYHQQMLEVIREFHSAAARAHIERPD